MSEIKRMPVIVIRDVVIMPGMSVNFTVIKPEAANASEEAMRGDRLIFVANQKEPSDELTGECLYPIGMIAKIKQINKLPNKSVQLILDSVERGRLCEIFDNTKFIIDVETIDEEVIDSFENEAMARNLRELFLEYSEVNNKLPKSLLRTTRDIDRIAALCDAIAGNTPIPYKTKLEILQAVNPYVRFDIVMKALLDEVRIERIRGDLKSKVSQKVTKSQKDYYLREEMDAIKKELGEDSQSEEEEFTRRLDKLNASKEIKEKILKEIKRLSSLNSSGSEASVERTYIETLLELPWDNASVDDMDILKAREILDRDHYGLEKVKDRVVEFLAVRALAEKRKGDKKLAGSKGESPIICLVGPPGTGKTSIAKSVAEALNKKYVRVCLGGVRDEAEIRGHRRTYVGAMPGNIIAGLKQAQVKNPLMLLDEIDKTSSDYKGDTSAALLEVLDSEQNAHFKDHYIGLPVDLSEVLFIATANSAGDIPRPLYDRMEVIEVTSYTANEKFHIAKEHLLRKQYAANGLKASEISINDAAIKKIIDSYTKEAGVRELERQIGAVARKAARIILEEGVKKVNVSTKNLEEFLGKEKYKKETRNKKDEVGTVRGLAWTAVGGTTLSIEVNTAPGKGELMLTGQMGDVMKESAITGISYLKSIADKYKVEPKFFSENDIHIHIPEGAVPKDGPSAGISMATAVLSAASNIPVKCNLAMTGEITLRGHVLAIGGLKEKLLAAKTAGITEVLVPKENVSDVSEISDEIKEGMNIEFVSTMAEVLEHALVK